MYLIIWDSWSDGSKESNDIPPTYKRADIHWSEY